jgi:hypothetical protein
MNEASDTHTRTLFNDSPTTQDGRAASVEPKGFGELGDFPTLLNKKNTPSLRKEKDKQPDRKKLAWLIPSVEYRRKPEAKN